MYLLIIVILLFLAELFYFKVADRCNIIDKPNERSSHTKVTLRGGGIIFYFGALAYFLTSGFEYPWFLLALTLVTFISFVDDIKSTGQMTRLLFHFSAMTLMFYQWGLFSLSWWWIVIALIVCTGIINAYNFMDGINGIETARRLRSLDSSIPVIFITIEESFALGGYTVQAMDYILKLYRYLFCSWLLFLQFPQACQMLCR